MNCLGRDLDAVRPDGVRGDVTKVDLTCEELMSGAYSEIYSGDPTALAATALAATAWKPKEAGMGCCA